MKSTYLSCRLSNKCWHKMRPTNALLSCPTPEIWPCSGFISLQANKRKGALTKHELKDGQQPKPQEMLLTLDLSSGGEFPRRDSVMASGSVTSICFSLALSVWALQGLLFIAFEAILVGCMNHACCERKWNNITKLYHCKQLTNREQDQTNEYALGQQES